MHHKTKSHSAVSFFYYVGNIVLNLQRRYDGKTRKSTFKYTIAEGDFLFTGQVWHRQQKILPFNSSIDSIFLYPEISQSSGRLFKAETSGACLKRSPPSVEAGDIPASVIL